MITIVDCIAGVNCQAGYASIVTVPVVVNLKPLLIIKHAKKFLLFNSGKTWIKKENNSLFEVTMGSFDGAEIGKLVGLFILKKLGQKFAKQNIGLYRDNRFAILKNKFARLAEKNKKDLPKIF